jgi:hypothetical protein
MKQLKQVGANKYKKDILLVHLLVFYLKIHDNAQCGTYKNLFICFVLTLTEVPILQPCLNYITLP